MTNEDARAALAAHCKTRWSALLTTCDVFFEGNADPDITTQSRPFGIFCVEPLRTDQLGVNGNQPPQRTNGVIEIVIFAKQGEGTRPLMQMTDAVTTMFATQMVGVIRCASLMSVKRVPAIGWQSRVLRVNYSFDS